MRTVYYCDGCGKPFENYQECADHEKVAHVVPKTYEKIKAYFYGEENIYPDELEVTMTDGSVISFFNDHMIKDADPAEKENAPLDEA